MPLGIHDGAGQGTPMKVFTEDDDRCPHKICIVRLLNRVLALRGVLDRKFWDNHAS
jgi:hypothetical protein